jgi:hypothetical protein
MTVSIEPEDFDLQTMLLEFQHEEIREKKLTRAARIAQWEGSHDEIPIERLMELHELMSEFVAKKFAKVTVREFRPLSSEEASGLMDEFLAMRTMSDALEARRAAIKAMVFQHYDAVFSVADILEPDTINGQLPVPEWGKKFVREGAGRKPPTLNTEELKKRLGVADWGKVVSRIEHPAIPEWTEVHDAQAAWTEELLDEDLLAEYLHSHPHQLEALRLSLTPGEKKVPRFTVRDL